MKARQVISTVISALFLLILPLYVENQYYNIVDAKFHIFLLVFVVVFIPSLIVWIVNSVKKQTVIENKLSIAEIGIIGLALIHLISSFCSGRFGESFFGSDGWYIGAFTVIAVAYLYFFFSRNMRYSQNIWIAIYTVSIFMFIIGLLDFARADPFGFRANIYYKNYYQFIATYGNTNWYTGYLCLIIPSTVVFFIASKRKTSILIELTVLVLGISNVILTICDSLYVGLGICAVAAIPFVFSKKQYIRRCVLVAVIFCAESIFIRIIPCYSILCGKATGLSKLMLDLRITVPMLIVFSALLAFLCIAKKEKDSLRKKIGFILVVVLSLGICSVIVYSAFTFNDKWGSSRGLIWRVSLENFVSYPWWRKIIGTGPDLLRRQYYEVQVAFRNLACLASHSEPVQLLLTTGISGFVFWVITVFGVIISYRKTVLNSENEYNILPRAFFFSMIAYLAQSFFNSATVVNLVYLCIIGAFFKISIHKKNNI